MLLIFCCLWPLESFSESTGAKAEDGDKEKEAKEISQSIHCGQACAFEAARELNSVLIHYFKNHKESFQEVSKTEHRKRVEKCIKDPENCKEEDQKAALNASLHYKLGRRARDIHLSLNTSRETLRSVKDANNDKLNTARSGAPPGDNQNVAKQENKKRQHFRFDEDSFTDDTERLKELDEDLVKEYRAFMSRYADGKVGAQYKREDFYKSKSIDLKGDRYEKGTTTDIYDEAFSLKRDEKGSLVHSSKREIDEELFESVVRDHKRLRTSLQEPAKRNLASIDKGAKEEDLLSFFQPDKKGAKKIAQEINKSIEKEFKEGKKKGTEVTLTTDIKKFDEFLDKIWPTGT